MSRLANVEKAGYFKIPPSVTESLVTHMSAPHGGRILDPCAGEGTALVAFAEKLGLDPFGVELHEGRAKAARDTVNQLVASVTDADEYTTRILHDSYLNLITSRAGYNLLYCNPPYDHDDEDGRLEYQWLWKTRPWLQPGGLLVYVVPRHILKMRKAVKYIASHYDQVRVYRFPDGAYERFKQIVLFGVRRPKGVVPDAAAVDALMAMGREETGLLPEQSRLEPLTACPREDVGAVPEPLYTLPPLVVKDNAFKLRSMFVDPADALAESQGQMGASTASAWRQHLCCGRSLTEPLPTMRQLFRRDALAAAQAYRTTCRGR